MATDIFRPETDRVDTVVELWVALAAGQQQYGSHILADTNRTQIRESILQRLAGDRLLVAERADICGFVTYSLERGTFEQDQTRGVVENLYVEPDARGEGVGTALLERAETALSNRGAEAITLGVMAENEAARRFYRRHGYEPHRIELEK